MPPKYKKRPDGRYKTKVYLGDGEYKYVYARTVKELELKAEELRYSMHKGGDILSGDLSFSTWADRFLMLKKSKVSDAYYKGIEGRVEFWKNAVGDLPISKITRSELQLPLDKLASHNPSRKRQTSEKTIYDYRRTAAGVFDLAISDRAITYNPAQYLTTDNGAKAIPRRALSDDEQRWIIDTPHRAQTAAMIMMLAGLRRGELIPLLVRDVDLDAATLSVDKSVQMVNGHPNVKKGGKTANATRVVNIPSQLVNHLRPLLSGRSPFELVCFDTKGRMFSETAFRRMWDSYLKDLNLKYGAFTEQPKSKFQPSGVPFVIPKITPHMLRHTCATNMILAGMDAITVKDQLGHSDIQTTLNIYTHVTAEHKASQVDRLTAFLAAKNIG